jgi:hypothetical protein
MSDWILRDGANGNRRTFDTKAAAEEAREDLLALGATSDDLEIVPPTETDGSGAVEPAVVDGEQADAQPVGTPGDDTPDTLDNRSVADDPIAWMPGEFVDVIDGTEAINRKGFEVLAHFYDVSVTATLQTAPEETGHEYCRVKATAETADGRTVQAFGSAHVDRGDDPWLLVEMAGTRARKRAISVATGAGAVAVEELKNEVER